MYISRINTNNSFKNNSNKNYSNYNTKSTFNASYQPVPYKQHNKSKKNWLIGGTIAAVTGIAAIAIYKKKNSLKIETTVKNFTDKEYIKNLTKGVSNSLGKDLSVDNLKSIMGKEEFLKVLPTLGKEDYLATKANKDNFKLTADLHSHTTASDGWGYAKDILNDAAKYGDELFKKTGKKFILAITDHDSVGSKIRAADGNEYMTGVKSAIEEIAQNPDKYKNIRLVLGAELSFLHKIDDKGGIGASEVLMHCIDPYSEKLNELINKVTKGRDKMIDSTILELNNKIPDVNFDRKEMWNHFINYEGNPNSKKEMFAYNLHYRVKNYAKIKTRVTQLAKQEGRADVTEVYNEVMDGFKAPKTDKCLESLDKHLESIDRKVIAPQNTIAIDKVCEETAFPKIIDGQIKSSSEFSLGDIAQVAQKENSVLGFAHPHLMVKQLENPQKMLDDIIKEANGLIKTSERYHQAYSSYTNTEDIDKTTNIIGKFNLINIGGRDNHSKGLFDTLV